MNENKSKYYEACHNEIYPFQNNQVNLLHGCINRICICTDRAELDRLVCGAIHHLNELNSIASKRLSLLEEYNVKDE